MSLDAPAGPRLARSGSTPWHRAPVSDRGDLRPQPGASLSSWAQPALAWLARSDCR